MLVTGILSCCPILIASFERLLAARMASIEILYRDAILKSVSPAATVWINSGVSVVLASGKLWLGMV